MSQSSTPEATGSAANRPAAPRVAVVPPSLPKGGGAMKGLGESFQADEFTGTASLSIPFPVTDCRGFAPSLSVDYGSGQGNGLFGLGFALSLPDISRQTAKGIPRYDERDVFLLSGADTLVPDVKRPDRKDSDQGVEYTVRHYRPRTGGAVARIECWRGPTAADTFWRVVDSGNTTQVFGRDPAARVADPADPGRIFRWLLEESRDPYGNLITYHYHGEDGTQLPDEPGRGPAAQKYPAAIRYGYYGDGPEECHFKVVFDYGEYDLRAGNPTPHRPVRSWPRRQDPFSRYDAGFEIRSHRLCRGILFFHRFPEPLGAEPVLVHAMEFQYRESPALTLMEQARFTGFQRQPDGSYLAQSLPPLTLEFGGFEPQGHDYQPFLERDGQAVPGVAQPPAYSLVDLYGEGVPGILYCDGASLLYWEAETADAAARYAPARQVAAFPIEREVDGATCTLTDLSGSGMLDLMVAAPGRAGYYTCRAEGDWQDFQAFTTFPSDYQADFQRLADLTGDGLADLIRVEGDRVRVYPALGRDGYGPAEFQARRPDLPDLRSDAPEESLRFADLAGAGHPQLARIADGAITYWPSLGHGRFGPTVAMAGAPRLGADFDAARMMLADLDGNGCADLIHIQAEALAVYRNLSGNGFDEPFYIPLPEPWDDLSQIQFADVHGNGTLCLVFSKTQPTQRQWLYDFCQRRKPYLLERIANNLGGETRLHYASSTQFYLEDKRQGHPWHSRIPFPVQVLAKIEQLDLISQGTLVSTFRYRHGYYDGEEGEFRGFGWVERQDGQSFSGEPGDAEFWQAPSRVRTWYHTGLWTPGLDLAERYRDEYYRGDCAARPLVPTHFQFAGASPDPATRREAHRALHGAMLRREVYGLDNTPWSAHPYAVEDACYQVRQLQDRVGERHGVFLVHARETLSYDYERNPDDPRVGHACTLKVDDYGHVERSCQVAYPRRQGGNAQQTRLRVVVEAQEYIHQTESAHWLGLPMQAQSWELKDLIPDQDAYFSFDGLAAKIGATPPSDERLSWERHYYYDPETEKALPFGTAGDLALPYRSESIAAAIEPLAKAFEDAIPPRQLNELLTRKAGDGGGYATYLEDPNPAARCWYWNPGASQTYLGAEGFFLPATTRDPFGQATGYAYDPYRLLVAKAQDPLGNSVEITDIDYRHLAPLQIKDANLNFQEVRLDPLGRVRVSSHHGTEGGQTVGFKPLAEYRDRPSPVLADEVLKDPAHYLQGAAEFYFYDLDSWRQSNESAPTPPHAVHLAAEDWPSAPDAAERIQIAIAYQDGFSRPLQAKQRVREGGPVRSIDDAGQVVTLAAAVRWLTSGAVRYNNKGLPVRQFEPFYTDQPGYIPSHALNETGVAHTLYYDALDRPVLTVDPKTFLSKVLYGEWRDAYAAPVEPWDFLALALYGEDLPRFQPSPWTQLHYDTNQTVKDSAYYRRVFPDRGEGAGVPPHEKASLKKAAVSHGHPVRQVLDNLGRTVETSQACLTPDIESGPPPRVGTWVELDTQGHPLHSADARLRAAGKINLSSVYTVAGEAIKTASVDAGTHWQLNNVMGQPIYSRDSRGVEQYQHYDELQRPILTQVREKNNPLQVVAVARVLYGDSRTAKAPYFTDPERWNSRGQAVAHLDSAGLVVSAHYSVHGQPLAALRCLCREYRQDPDWRFADDTLLKALADAIAAVDRPEDLEKHLQLPEALALREVLEKTERHLALNQYDGLGRVIQSTDPDGNLTRPAYDSLGRLRAVGIVPNMPHLPGAAPAVLDIGYDAKGQRSHIRYANGVETRYRYEAETFRLIAIDTTRPGHGEPLQALRYYYDPVGNITHIIDLAAPPVYCGGQAVEGESDYLYDTVYRLVKASGREHPGLWDFGQRGTQAESRLPLAKATAGDGQKLQNYTQRYDYDLGGNLTSIRHEAAASSACWTRTLTIAEDSNRLRSSHTGGGQPIEYTYDESGHQTRLEGLKSVKWDYRGQLREVVILPHGEAGAVNDAEYYVYDGGGQRVRKVTERQAGGGLVHIDEVIYLGMFEISRKTSRNAGTIELKEEWHTAYLADDQTRVAEWRYQQTGKATKGSDISQTYYRLDDHLGSCTLELNEAGKIISFEQYYPYGGTAVPHENAREVQRKRYRYSGKEKDASTGLYYYGARYYCPGICRWLSTDPAGTVDGLNLYGFVSGNPVVLRDYRGKHGKNSTKKRKRESSPESVSTSESTSTSQPTNKKQKTNKTEFPQYFVEPNHGDIGKFGGTSLTVTLGPGATLPENHGSDTSIMDNDFQKIANALGDIDFKYTNQSEKKSLWVKAHLLNAKLGGCGTDINNLVMLTSTANIIHSGLELKVKNFLDAAQTFERMHNGQNDRTNFWFGIEYTVTVSDESFGVEGPNIIPEYLKVPSYITVSSKPNIYSKENMKILKIEDAIIEHMTRGDWVTWNERYYIDKFLKENKAEFSKQIDNDDEHLKDGYYYEF